MLKTSSDTSLLGFDVAEQLNMAAHKHSRKNKVITIQAINKEHKDLTWFNFSSLHPPAEATRNSTIILKMKNTSLYKASTTKGFTNKKIT